MITRRGSPLERDSPGAKYPAQWKGENLLGFVWVEDREKLKR